MVYVGEEGGAGEEANDVEEGDGGRTTMVGEGGNGVVASFIE